MVGSLCPLASYHDVGEVSTPVKVACSGHLPDCSQNEEVSIPLMVACNGLLLV